MKDIFRGELVRLAVESPETIAKAQTRWLRDSELLRLAESDPAQMWSEKKRKEWAEKQMEKDGNNNFRFSIRTLSDDLLIGEISIHPQWVDADAWVGIGLGERDYWGRGYGTDAMRLIVQYGFIELNLQRVSLALHSYNDRALKSYEKVGFKVEGTLRQDTLREGRRTDGIFMGILRDEWLAMQGDNV
jgi:RimJ/RimL family protein N-acetyltransferase